MAAKLKEVRERMVSVRSTQQITKAMKMVSAAKLRKTQDAMQQIRIYHNKLSEVTSKATQNLMSNNIHPLYMEHQLKHVLIVCVTSDRGLCGAFNTNIIKQVKELVAERYYNQKVTIWCIGKKGYEALQKLDCDTSNKFVRIAHPFNIAQVYACTEQLIMHFKQKKCNKIILVYSRFYNAMKQAPTVETMLPLQQKIAKKTDIKQLDYIYQQPPKEFLDNVLPRIIKAQLIKAIFESAASEHGARMSAMDKATENANELQKELKITYNTARQAAITNELNEIVSGSAALLK